MGVLMADDATDQSPASPAETPDPATSFDVVDTPPSSDWGNVLIVAAGAPASGETRKVIVVETRDDTGALIERTYPTADLYYRTDPNIALGAGNTVTLGYEVTQTRFAGMCSNPAEVAVGPCSPTYGAINVALHLGAHDVEVIGLTAAQKAVLQPWLDQVSLPVVTLT